MPDDVTQAREELAAAEIRAVAATAPQVSTAGNGGSAPTVSPALVKLAEAERREAQAHADALQDQIDEYHRSRAFYVIALAILGLVVLIITGGGIAAAFTGDEIPAWAVGLAGTALGAIAGLFTPSPIQRSGTR